MPYKDPVKRKEYHKQHSANHYRQNKQDYLDRIKAKKELLKQILRELREETPCADCGLHYPYYVMDLDHLPGTTKVEDPSRLANSGSISKFLTEIDKCEVVCSNCHRKRTYDRAQ